MLLNTGQGFIYKGDLAMNSKTMIKNEKFRMRRALFEHMWIQSYVMLHGVNPRREEIPMLSDKKIKKLLKRILLSK